MPKLPVISGEKAIKTLERLGFTIVRQRGSHVVLRRGPFGCVVPNHRELKVGTLERKEWISHPHLADRRQQLQEYADHTLQSQQTIEITLSKAELAIIEQFALKAGISSRALIVSVLHQFVINSSQWKLEEKVK